MHMTAAKILCLVTINEDAVSGGKNVVVLDAQKNVIVVGELTRILRFGA
jgi:hypothetical protein